MIFKGFPLVEVATMSTGAVTHRNLSFHYGWPDHLKHVSSPKLTRESEGKVRGK